MRLGVRVVDAEADDSLRVDPDDRAVGDGRGVGGGVDRLAATTDLQAADPPRIDGREIVDDECDPAL